MPLFLLPLLGGAVIGAGGAFALNNTADKLFVYGALGFGAYALAKKKGVI